jgi:hypothetical protein
MKTKQFVLMFVCSKMCINTVHYNCSFMSENSSFFYVCSAQVNILPFALSFFISKLLLLIKVCGIIRIIKMLNKIFCVCKG